MSIGFSKFSRLQSIVELAQSSVHIGSPELLFIMPPIELICGLKVISPGDVTDPPRTIADKDEHAFLSQHIGDMENEETLEHFENTIGLYKKLFRIEPEIMAYDMHPEYLATGDACL